MPDYDPDDPWTYFGIWSAKDIALAAQFLQSLDVKFYHQKVEESEATLREWNAWDSHASEPNNAFLLWIHDEDLTKLGDQLVLRFPERRFGRKEQT